MSSSSSTTATTTSSPSTADSLVSTPPPLQPLPSSSPPPPHVLTIHANFYVDEGQATSRFQQLLDMADVWVDPKTFMTAAGVEQRIKCTKMFLFDPVDRYAPDGALQHLPNGCVPLDTSDVKMPCDVVKAYRPLTAAPLVADMVSAAMQGLTFRNAPLVFNLVIGTLLKDRSGRVTIHPNADSSDAPLAVIVFGAPCLLTVNAHRNDGGTRTVSVSSGSIVCLGPASMHGKKTLSVVLAKTGGGGSIVLVMRHASKAYTRVQLQRRLDNAEREKKKRAAALYAKLCAATTATVSGAVAIDEDDNNADNEEEEEGSEHNGGGCGDGNDDDEDDNDDDGALHASKKRMRG